MRLAWLRALQYMIHYLFRFCSEDDTNICEAYIIRRYLAKMLYRLIAQHQIFKDLSLVWPADDSWLKKVVRIVDGSCRSVQTN